MKWFFGKRHVYKCFFLKMVVHRRPNKLKFTTKKLFCFWRVLPSLKKNQTQLRYCIRLIMHFLLVVNFQCLMWWAMFQFMDNLKHGWLSLNSVILSGGFGDFYTMKRSGSRYLTISKLAQVFETNLHNLFGF